MSYDNLNQFQKELEQLCKKHGLFLDISSKFNRQNIVIKEVKHPLDAESMKHTPRHYCDRKFDIM